MNSTARAVARLGAGAAAVAVLAGCGGGSGGSGKAAPVATAVTATAAATTEAATPTPTTASGMVPHGLTKEALRAGLPSAAALGATDPGYAVEPVDDDRPSGYPPAPLLIPACLDLYTAGDSRDARASADLRIYPSDPNSDLSRQLYVSGRQYDVGGGAGLFRAIADRAGECGKWTQTTDKGTVADHKQVVEPASGLGDQAEFIRHTITLRKSGYVLEDDTLVVRYGDVVIVVADGDDPREVKAFDMVARVKAYAAKLGLR